MKMVHVTIHSTCLEESIAFYRDIAGLTLAEDLRPAGMPIVFLANGEGETQVELIAAEEAKKYSGSGISLGFKVGNAKACREELLSKGYSPSPMIRPNPQTEFFFVKDPNGLDIQFI